MSDRYFPITAGVACPLKWTWNTVRLQEGTTASCHRVNGVPLDPSNFDNFHNNATWIEHRKQMLEGTFPQAGCQYCEKIERAGGTSDRQTHLKIPNLVPHELEADPTALVVTPRILEVFLDNTCNLACVYCDESNSSRIEQENKRYGYIPVVNQQSPRSVDFDKLVEGFFAYLDKNYTHFRRLHVLGGEPFFQTQFDRLMDYVSTHSNPELELNIVTNLMVAPKKLEKFIAQAKQLLVERRIKRLDITASIDCWGVEQEYIRYGINMAEWQQNFDMIAQQKWITVNANSAITVLSIKTMPKLIEFLNQYRKFRNIHHTFGHVDIRPHLHCEIFGKGFFDKAFDDVVNCMDSTTVWGRNQIEYMLGLKKVLSTAEVNLEQLGNLQSYLDELDRRRDLNWRGVFPWLDEYFKENNINVV